MYAPSDSARVRPLLWHQLKGLLPDGQWILLGDFNMTEIPLDSSGPSPLVIGQQREAWRLLKTRLYLVDAFSLHRTFIGMRYTQRAAHGNRMDQSRIDRLYISERGHWIHAILKLEHIQSHTLSDHDPIVLIVQTSPLPPTTTAPKSTYFKASIGTLKIVGTINALKEACREDHTTDDSNPTLKFALAWTWLRQVYKTTQEKEKPTEPPLTLLQAKYVQLKMDMIDEYIP